MTADMGYTGGTVNAERVILVGTDGVPYSATGGGGGGAGDASAANQVTGNASLAAIDANAGAAADAAVTTNTTGTVSGKLRGLVKLMIDLIAKTPALGTAGSAAVDVITVQGIASGTAQAISAASLPLPAGAATSAAQTTAATSLGNIDTNQGALADAETSSGNGSVIAILKRVRTLLAGGLPAALAANGGLKIEGVASGVAVPVSNASLPLPTGASTAAKQPALGTAGSASTDVITVQGIASGTAQPASQSGTWTVQPGNTANTTAWKVDGSAVTQPVSGTVTSTPTSYTAPVSGELVGVTSATVLPTITCKMVQFVASATNTGKVYLGPSGVTKAAGTTTTTAGIQLSPGQSSGWVPIDNLNRLYRICDNVTDHTTYLAMN